LNLEAYRQKRRLLSQDAPKYRNLCVTCLQPEFGCYCSHIQRFDPRIKFAILIHPIEVKRRIATGRMSHLVLQNSELIMGQDYTDSAPVNEIINDHQNYPVILYPGRTSVDLTPLSLGDRAACFPRDKKLVIFVIDGTWATARKTMWQSQNLMHLPRICFTPPTQSNFRVRKQPAPGCYSTIEAIHHTIDLIGETQGFDIAGNEHHKLLLVFEKMVEKQLDFIRLSQEKPWTVTYRRLTKRQA
jgi:DTW domain-containing protein YfiP